MADGGEHSQETLTVITTPFPHCLALIHLLLGQMRLAQAEHCYITTVWKQNQFIQLTATHSLEEIKTSVGDPPSYRRGMARWEAGRRRADLSSGASRTSVLCSSRRTLQRESVRERERERDSFLVLAHIFALVSPLSAFIDKVLRCVFNSPGSSWLLFPISPTKELTLCPSKKKKKKTNF